MSNPRLTLAQLRQELHDLAESITGYAPPPNPDRFERDNHNKIGPEWHVATHPGGYTRLVRVITGEPEVFMEGGTFGLSGDIEAMTTREARSFAIALLAAADWADGQDEIGQRRAASAQKERGPVELAPGPVNRHRKEGKPNT